MSEVPRATPPLTRRNSRSGGRPSGLAPLNVGAAAHLAPGAISLDSPHLTGLSSVLAHSGLASPAARPPLDDPDAWKHKHMPGSSLATASAAAGPMSPNKRKSGGFRQQDMASFQLLEDSKRDEDDDDDDDDDDDETNRGMPGSPTKRRSNARSFVEPPPAEEAPRVTVTDVFAPGMMRCPVFRIPSVLPLPDGVVLVFSEARQSWSDHGVIDLVCRRSEDDGYTWGPARTVAGGSTIGQARKATVGNPTAVWDRDTETVWLVFCSNLKEDQEWQIHARQGKDKEGRRVWVTSSADRGKTWATPKEITASVKHRGWTWYAAGPGAGVQLRGGRLLLPANHAEDVTEEDHPYLVAWKHSRMVAHCIYSDDHGRTWRVGGVAAKHTNECTLAERADGSIILNARDWSGRFVRQVQVSTDQGNSWQPARYDRELIEPHPQGCQGSILAIPQPGGAREALFFCNPSSHERRELMTIRRSDDGGATWSRSFVLEEGAAAYSCLGRLSSGALCCCYERADRISFAVIPPSHAGPLGAF